MSPNNPSTPPEIQLMLPEMHPHQREILASNIRFRIVACGRRFGKTTIGERAILIHAVERQHTCWWLAPTYQMAAHVWRHLKTAIRDLPEVTLNEANLRMEFSGGGSIAIRSTHLPDNLRGEGLDFAVLDEAAFMPPDIWSEIVRPMLLERQGNALFLSSPNGKNNWFYRLYLLGLNSVPPLYEVERGLGGEEANSTGDFGMAVAEEMEGGDAISTGDLELPMAQVVEDNAASPSLPMFGGVGCGGVSSPPLHEPAKWGGVSNSSTSQSNHAISYPPRHEGEGLGVRVPSPNPHTSTASVPPPCEAGDFGVPGQRGLGGGDDNGGVRVSPLYQSFHFPTSANPLISKDELAAIQHETPERIWRTEYLAEFTDDLGQVFRGIREAATAPVNAQPRPQGRYVFGVDWGREGDYTAITVMDADTNSVVAIDRFNQINWSLQRGRLRALYDRWNPYVIYAEANSIGSPNIEALQAEGLPVRPFLTTASSKPDLIESLALAVERHDLSLILHDDLLGELSAYAMERLPSGGYRYSAPVGLHDDLVISLALAWHALRYGSTLFSFA